MTVEVKIDRRTCGGYAYCMSAAPVVFDLDDDFKAYVLPEADLGDDLDAIKSAAWECPVQAISVVIDGEPLGPES